MRNDPTRAGGSSPRTPAGSSPEMDIIAGLSGLLIGAVVAWLLAQGMAAAEMSRAPGAHARTGPSLARGDRTSQGQHGPDLRADGRLGRLAAQQGREDVLSLTRALAQHITQPGDGSTLG